MPNSEDLEKVGIKGEYFYSYFKKWNPQENFYYATENTGFSPNQDRTEGTYSKYSSIDDKIEANKKTVQDGDPFTEKILLEA